MKRENEAPEAKPTQDEAVEVGPDLSRRRLLARTAKVVGLGAVAVYGPPLLKPIAWAKGKDETCEKDPGSDKNPSSDKAGDKDPTTDKTTDKDPTTDKTGDKDPASDKDPNEKDPAADKDPTEKDPHADKDPNEKDEEGGSFAPPAPRSFLAALTDEWGPDV